MDQTKNTGLGKLVTIEHEDISKQFDYPHYIANKQRCALSTKRQWL